MRYAFQIQAFSHLLTKLSFVSVLQVSRIEQIIIYRGIDGTLMGMKKPCAKVWSSSQLFSFKTKNYIYTVKFSIEKWDCRNRVIIIPSWVQSLYGRLAKLVYKILVLGMGPAEPKSAGRWCWQRLCTVTKGLEKSE